jgi:PAS domain S-box-containing protein
VGTWDWNIVENSITWDDFIHPLFGLKPGTFSGGYDAFLALVDPGDRDRVNREVNRAVVEGAEYDTEFRVLWPDGTRHVLGARGKVYRDAQGQPIRMTGVCWDLTQRKQAEEDRDRLVAVLEATSDFVGMARPDGSVLYLNRAGRRMIGMDENAPVTQTTIPDYHPGWALALIIHEAIPIACRQGVWSGETALRRVDGTEIPVSQVVLAHKNEAGDVDFLATIIRDISDRKRAEEQLRRTAARLARSNTELEQFAYISSHDLQEPLRKVQQFGDLLVSSAGEALDEQCRLYVHRMQDAACRMQALINDLLTFSRVHSQAKPFVEVDLARVAEEVVADLEARIQSTGGHVQIGPLPRLYSEPTQMRQLLQNLISNALKFHRPDVPPVVVVGSRIVNNGAEASLDHSRSDLLCEITVQDNGIGFDEKYLDRIFQPFERLHGRGAYEGTGMGLAICRKIVERHWGTITARSTPGKGSTFIVALPLRQPTGESPHEQAW